MVLFEQLDVETKKAMMHNWKNMSESEKMHFINQVALALSVWGSDLNGKKKVVDVLKALMGDGSSNLSDFGVYIKLGIKDMSEKEKRAMKIIERYRLRYNLPAEPNKPII